MARVLGIWLKHEYTVLVGLMGSESQFSCHVVFESVILERVPPPSAWVAIWKIHAPDIWNFLRAGQAGGWLYHAGFSIIRPWWVDGAVEVGHLRASHRLRDEFFAGRVEFCLVASVSATPQSIARCFPLVFEIIRQCLLGGTQAAQVVVVKHGIARLGVGVVVFRFRLRFRFSTASGMHPNRQSADIRTPRFRLYWTSAAWWVDGGGVSRGAPRVIT